MQKADGSGRITTNGNMVFKDGQYVGLTNQFGETVTNSGSYRNNYGDITDSNGNNVGHVYGNPGYYVTNGSSESSVSGSGSAALPAGCIAFVIALVIVIGKVLEAFWAYAAIGTLFYEGFSSGEIQLLFSEHPFFYAILAVIAVLYCVVVLAKGAVLKKATGKFWPAFIPVYNEYKLIKSAGGVWYILLATLVPAGFVFVDIYRNYKLATKYGKGTGFIFGLTLLPAFYLPALSLEIDSQSSGINHAKSVVIEDDNNPVYCPFCLSEVSENAKFCPSCGSKFEWN